MKKRISLLTSLLAVVVLILLSRPVNSTIPKTDPNNEDIHYSFLEGERLVNGQNPYARIIGSDMRTNQKYPTYFPLFYEVSYLSQNLGLSSFENWLGFFLKIFKGFEWLIALLIFAVLALRNLEWVGVVAAAFWMFNRWTLYIITTSNFDFIPIFFMLLAFVLFPRYKWLALLSFSISLGLKQIAIFVAPLFVIWMFTAESRFRKGILQALKGGLVIASVPLVSSLPFLFWSLEGFIRSIAFSATRFADTNINLEVNSVDTLLGWQGLAARIPMFLLFLAIYWMVLKGIGKRYLPAVLIFVVFISFNAVLYYQYMTWLISLVPLLLVDYVNAPDNLSFRWVERLLSRKSRGRPVEETGSGAPGLSHIRQEMQ